MIETLLNQQETIETMEDRELKIIQNKIGYRFNSDSFLLVDFLFDRIKHNTKNEKFKVADLGAGVGIMSCLLAKSHYFNRIVAFEIQKSLAAIAHKNVVLNKQDNLIDIRCQDFAQEKRREDALFYDFIICNPPYKKIGTGKQNSCKEKLIARHEIKVCATSIAKSINYLMKPDGQAYIVYPTVRLPEIMITYKKHHLEPKSLQFVYHSINHGADIFLLELSKGGKESLKVLNPIFIKH